MNCLFLTFLHPLFNRISVWSIFKFSFRSFSCILNIRPLSISDIANIFSQAITHLLHLSMAPCFEEKHLLLKWFVYLVLLKNPSPPRSQGHSPTLHLFFLLLPSWIHHSRLGPKSNWSLILGVGWVFITRLPFSTWWASLPSSIQESNFSPLICDAAPITHQFPNTRFCFWTSCPSSASYLPIPLPVPPQFHSYNFVLWPITCYGEPLMFFSASICSVQSWQDCTQCRILVLLLSIVTLALPPRNVNTLQTTFPGNF